MRIKSLSGLVGSGFRKSFPGFLDSEELEGALVDRCERRFEEVHRVPASHSVTGVSNGTDALILALEALDIGFGDEVIVPGLTWQATAGSVLDVNAVPVLIDVLPGTLCLDPDRVERYLEGCVAERRRLPRAIIVVHLFASAADMDKFAEICRRYNVALIEDCAHAHGASWRGRALGTFGAIGTFSTQRTKPLAGRQHPDEYTWECPTGSEGGFIVTGVPTLDIRVRALASCGRRVENSQISSTARPDELTAYWRTRVDELGLPTFPIQSGNNRLPASVAERLLDELDRFREEHEQRGRGLVELSDALGHGQVPGITLLASQPELTTPVAHMFPFRYAPDHFSGMDSELFRQVLMHLMDGYLVDIPYHPLGGGPADYTSPVYNPNSKRRYRISEEHWAAINPARWDLPNAHYAYRHVVVLEHTALREPGIATALTDALTWMHERAESLVNAAS